MSIICEMFKNTREKVIFKLTEYKHRHYLDLRVFLVGEDTSQTFPTKKGLTLAVELYPQLKEALAQVEVALITRGLLDREDLEAHNP